MEIFNTKEDFDNFCKSKNIAGSSWYCCCNEKGQYLYYSKKDIIDFAKKNKVVYSTKRDGYNNADCELIMCYNYYDTKTHWYRESCSIYFDIKKQDFFANATSRMKWNEKKNISMEDLASHFNLVFDEKELY